MTQNNSGPTSTSEFSRKEKFMSNVLGLFA